MTDKEKVVQFIVGMGLTYIELAEEGAALHAAWDEWCEDYGLRQAPFTAYLGIVPNERTIVARPHHHWTTLIHEAAHLLCERSVFYGEEIGWFGWEWAVVQHLGLSREEFLRENRDYTISWEASDERWVEDVRDLRADEVDRFFNKKVAEAQRLGVVTEDGIPVAHENWRVSDEEGIT